MRRPLHARVWFAALALALAASAGLAQNQPAAPAQASPAAQPAKPQQNFDSVLNPNAAEQVKRQQQQPGNNSPVWKEIRSEKSFYTTAQGPEAGVLIQSGGETWRQRRNNQLIPFGGALFAGVFGLCVLFYAWKGTINLKAQPTGRKMPRFTPFERTIHWTVAISFSILAISGLVMLFGKHVLLPIIGHTLFAWLTILLKNLHNFIGPLFSVAVVILFFTFLKNNWPKLYDITWLVKGGGLATGAHIPSDKFNAGEKVWFWAGALVLGLIVSVTGLVLDFPNFEQTRATMQLASVIHIVATVLFMSMALGHIYMGTIGMAGAFDAMKTGYVDEAWAKEHHEYWYEEMKKSGAAPAAPGSSAGGPAPAAAPQAKEKSA